MLPPFGFTQRPMRFVSAILIAAGASSFAGPLDYSRDVQPILSEHCYHCHGPDAKSREAKLRLDVREGREGAFRTHRRLRGHGA